MADTRVLAMKFRNVSNGSVSISLNDPKTDLTKVLMQAAMSTIIDENIFGGDGGDFATLAGATITTKSEEVLF